MALEDKDLWDYLLNQDLYVPQEFGIGIIGIGALLIAFGSQTSSIIKVLIALVGLCGSFILWMHMFAARKERLELQKELEKTSKQFVQRLEKARSWRYQGIYRFVYYPVTQLMTYFMGWISVAWAIIILRIFGTPLEALIVLTIVALLLFLTFAAYQRYRSILEHHQKLYLHQGQNSK